MHNQSTSHKIQQIKKNTLNKIKEHPTNFANNNQHQTASKTNRTQSNKIKQHQATSNNTNQNQIKSNKNKQTPNTL